MAACGIDTTSEPQLHEVDFSTSHEALVLGYEEALTRQDSLTGDWYDCSAHMLWIGERTRQLDGAHVHFLSGVEQPRRAASSARTPRPTRPSPSARRSTPTGCPGRLTLITRMGADHVAERLPPLLRAVQEAGHPVVWACDPMHGNTYTSGERKTRHFDDICREIEGFFAAHRAVGTWPGGIHLELTGEDVTECLGGGARRRPSWTVATRPCAIPASTPASPSIWPSGCRRCSTPDPLPWCPVTDSTRRNLDQSDRICQDLGNPEWSDSGFSSLSAPPRCPKAPHAQHHHRSGDRRPTSRSSRSSSSATSAATSPRTPSGSSA